MARQPLVTAPYPYVPVRFVINGHEHSESALVDTGFTGEIAIPASLLSEDLGVAQGDVDVELANGSSVKAPLYAGTLEISQFPSFPVAITVLGNEYILGLGAIDRYEVTFDHGQRVILRP
jgi:predicted aspartyl protease